MKRPVYIGYFLTEESRSRLLAAFPAKHAQVYCDHLTIVFNPTDEQLETWRPLIGMTTKLKIYGEASDEKCQAVKADGASTNKHPHITVSTAQGTKPVYSNEMLQCGEYSWKEASLVLDAVVDIYPRTKTDLKKESKNG